MSDREMTVREAISEYLADGDGGFNRGINHAFTVGDIVNKLEIPNNNDNKKIVQIEILQELKHYRNTYNELAGGMFRNPTKYLIAETFQEESAIIARHMNITKAMVGGLESRVETSNSPVLVAMISAINGMVKSLNALTTAIHPKEKDNANDEQLKLGT